MSEFHIGDLVHVTRDRGDGSTAHDIDAIVIEASVGRSSPPAYSLFLKGKGHHAWFHDPELTLLETGREDLLKEWEATLEAEHELHAGLDWIFANAKRVIENPPGASLQALANCLNLGSLWGSRGEGYQWYINAHAIHDLVVPYLEASDRAGWNSMCTKYLEEQT